MKAIVCNTPGKIDDLAYAELSMPEIGEDEVLIKVQYAGVNYPDILISEGRYQFKPERPFSPGGEAAGVVIEIGKNVGYFAKGDRVLCAMGWGGFAEYVVAKAINTFHVPEKVKMSDAAVLLETYATALYALKDRAHLVNGERLVVLGASGGTGTAAVQLGKLFEAEVVAITSSDEKGEHALNQGADVSLNLNKLEVKSKVKALGGADVIFDPVGGAVSEQLFRAINPLGRHLVVGFASGEIPTLPWNLPLLKSASITGVFWGWFWRNQPIENRRNVTMLLKWLEQKKITPSLFQEYSLSNAVLALKDLKERRVQGKIVLRVAD